jgi:hypothetical protein
MNEHLLEPDILKERIKKVAEASLSRYITDPVELNKSSWFITNRITGLFNEHSQSTMILNRLDKDRIGRLRARAEYLQRKISERTPEDTAAIKTKYGEEFKDFQSAELSAIEWAIKFIEEHSL